MDCNLIKRHKGGRGYCTRRNGMREVEFTLVDERLTSEVASWTDVARGAPVRCNTGRRRCQLKKRQPWSRRGEWRDEE